LSPFATFFLTQIRRDFADWMTHLSAHPKASCPIQILVPSPADPQERLQIVINEHDEICVYFGPHLRIYGFAEQTDQEIYEEFRIEALRFVREEIVLAIKRENGRWKGSMFLEHHERLEQRDHWNEMWSWLGTYTIK